MSQRIEARGFSPGGLTSEDVRRQLEGRAELLEAARTREALLESVLRGPGWKRRLRANPDLVPECLTHVRAIAEALEVVRHRAARDGWPGDLPLMKVVRELEARRARLTTRVRERLARLVAVSGEPRFDAELRRLNALVRKRASLSLGAKEVVLFKSVPSLKEAPGQWRWLLAYFFLLYWGLPHLFFAVLGGIGPWLGVWLMALTLAPVLGLLWSSGRVWLTHERLLWVPLFGEAVSVPLDSIAPGGIALGPAHSVRVEGEPRAVVRQLSEAGYLATLLELHSQPPLRGMARSGIRLADVALYPAELQEGTSSRSGWAVLRPGGVSFIPGDMGREALEAVTGRPTQLPGDVKWVLEQLCWLSDAEFDASVVRVVEATGGVSWSAWDALRREAVPVWQRLRIARKHQRLTGQVEWSSQSAAERVLRSWPEVSARAAPDVDAPSGATSPTRTRGP